MHHKQNIWSENSYGVIVRLVSKFKLKLIFRFVNEQIKESQLQNSEKRLHQDHLFRELRN
jgi:hypothetical protein